MKDLGHALRKGFGILAVWLCSAALLAGVAGCSKQDLRQSMREARRTVDKLIAQAQTKPQEDALPAAKLPAAPAKAKKAAKAEAVEEAPTQLELVEYLRGKLLTLSPSDGFNDNAEVRFNAATGTLTVVQPISRCDLYLGALDASNITWDTFDPSDDQNERPPLLRLTAASVSGKKARSCFDVRGLPEDGTSTNRARLLFSLAKAEEIAGFKQKMAKTMKALILLSGGVEGKEFFPDPKDKLHSKKE